MKRLICVLIVLICVQHWPVEAKNRNRVQKWQQRTWRTRFGSAPKSDWKFDGPVKGKSHRKNFYASSRYGKLSQKELDLLSRNQVPNGYSNFHFQFNEPKSVPITYGSVGRGHRNGKKKDAAPDENQIQNYRMKRFAFQGEEDDDDEPVQFTNDLADAPFVFDTDARLKDEYAEDQGFNNDLVDIDFVRDDDGFDFIPIQPGPNQRYITVEENDPFPHALPPASPAPDKKNATRKVQYTLIIHHGERNGAVDRRRRGVSALCLLWPLVGLFWANA